MNICIEFQYIYLSDCMSINSDISTDPAPKTVRCDEHTPLVDSISKIVYEMRELEDLILLIRSDIRNHDDKTIKLFEQNTKLTIEIGENNNSLTKLDRLLNEAITKQNILSLHLAEAVEIMTKDTHSDDNWLKNQFEKYQKAQLEQMKFVRQENAKLMWKLIGVIVTLAGVIAGMTQLGWL